MIPGEISTRWKTWSIARREADQYTCRGEKNVYAKRSAISLRKCAKKKDGGPVGEKRLVRYDMRRKIRGRPWASPGDHRGTAAARHYESSRRNKDGGEEGGLPASPPRRYSREYPPLLLGNATEAIHSGCVDPREILKDALYLRAPDRDISVGSSRPRPSSSRTDVPLCTGTSLSLVCERVARHNDDGDDALLRAFTCVPP